MGEVSVLHFSCFVWRSVSHWKSCPRGCSTIRDLNSLPSSLASVKLLRSLSQKWVRQILISPLKNVNYHDGNRKVIQQLSLSAGLWASSETECWHLSFLVTCEDVTWAKGRLSEQAVLHSWLRRDFAARSPGWQRFWIRASNVNWRQNVLGDSHNRRAWGLKMCSSGNLTVKACQTLHLRGSCAALQQSKLSSHTSAGKGHA